MPVIGGYVNPIRTWFFDANQDAMRCSVRLLYREILPPHNSVTSCSYSIAFCLLLIPVNNSCSHTTLEAKAFRVSYTRHWY